MTHDEKTPEEERFWEEFHRALDAAGNPSMAKISRDVTEEFDEDLPASTLREWISIGRLPRDGEVLLMMMRAIGAEKQCDWEVLRERAWTARANRPRPDSNLSDVSQPEPEPEPVATEEPPLPRDPDVPTPREPDKPSRRVSWWWVALGAAAAVIATTVIALKSSDDSGAVQAAGTTPSAEVSRGKNTPCRPPDDVDRAPTAPTGTPPAAYAKGGTGRVEAIQENRELVVVDSLADGCAIIVTAKADGAVTGTWASTLGKTGRVKRGKPTPPKHIVDAWPDGTQNVELRACYGEVLNDEIVFDESACGDWISIRLAS